jgi:DNA-binding NtrC family response regulator
VPSRLRAKRAACRSVAYWLRLFHRLGETKEQHFRGKLIAAAATWPPRCRSRGSAPAFYYRLCSDVITTPSLAEQLRQRPEELHHLVEFLADRSAGADEPPGGGRRDTESSAKSNSATAAAL